MLLTVIKWADKKDTVGRKMSQGTPIQQDLINVSVQAKKSQILAAALLGITVLMAVGFAPIEVIHNATHDTRHSTGFPCH